MRPLFLSGGISPRCLFIPVITFAWVTALASVGHAGWRLKIESLPQETRGPFVHNVFHKAHRGGNGDVLGWFDLDPTRDSFYNPHTGNLSLYVNIFSESDLKHQIGTAYASSTNLKGRRFNRFRGQPIGTITWSIMLTDTESDFFEYMEDAYGLRSSWSVTMTFVDKKFAKSRQGYVANSWNRRRRPLALTLWGADGYSRKHGYRHSRLGADMVAQMAHMPAPPTLVYLISGLATVIGFGVVGGRRRLRLPSLCRR